MPVGPGGSGGACGAKPKTHEACQCVLQAMSPAHRTPPACFALPCSARAGEGGGYTLRTLAYLNPYPNLKLQPMPQPTLQLSLDLTLIPALNLILNLTLTLNPLQRASW